MRLTEDKKFKTMKEAKKEKCHFYLYPGIWKWYKNALLYNKIECYSQNALLYNKIECYS